MASRCTFRPYSNPEEHPLDSNNKVSWIPIISCPADFPPELFEIAILQLIHHPEYNSTLILRSETIHETLTEFPPCVPQLQGLIALKNVHRKLLPRRPDRDKGLEQHCTIYGTSVERATTLVLTPIFDVSLKLPYYHPSVFHIAFRYIESNSEAPRLQIEVVPFSNTPVDLNSRLYRTCLALLETLHRYGWGAANNYKKRVNHDCLVPRGEYQDLYLKMRARHGHLVDTWQESTDPLKHVFEDIGIATFLMLLWKAMYSTSVADGGETVPEEPWRDWPKPPGGFVDLGCGNGLLVHILILEGYSGYGTDVRSRISWSHFPERVQQHLHICPLNPINDKPDLPAGAFLIGNHADELTPWIPVIASMCYASGYLNLPCCPWEFDQRYTRSETFRFPVPSPDFAQKLNLGGDGKNTSSYSMYRIWLARLSFYCGWNTDVEVLRIPSTRNWALVGRSKHTDESVNRAHVEEIITQVRERGIFATRTPEGKGRDH